MKALIRKELRENARWFPVGLFVLGAVCWMVRPDHMNSQALLAMDLVTQMAIVAPLLAFALGMVQAHRDLQPAAAAYLNHRSVTPSDVFFAKLVAGFALYTLSLIVPLLALAGWIAYHGMQWHPMRPAQVLPALVHGLASFVMHPAAMLMLARGASWWGTRLFPLLPAGAALIPLFAMLRTGGLWGAGVGAVSAIPILAWMIAIARRGWRDFSSDPPAWRINHRLRGRWLLPSYLVVGMLVCVVTAMVFLVDGVQNWGRSNVYVPRPYASVAIDSASGHPWLLTYLNGINPKSGMQETSVLGGAKIVSDQSVDPMGPLEGSERFKAASQLSPVQGRYMQTDGFFSSFTQLEGTTFFYAYDSRGYILCYSRSPEARWTQTIAADGVRPAGQLQGQPFTSDAAGTGTRCFHPFREAGYAAPLIDSQGVYLLDVEPLSIRRLIDQPIDAATLVEAEEGHAPRLILRSKDQLLEYQFLDAEGTDTWYNAPDADGRGQYRPDQKTLSELSLTAKLVRTYEMSPSMPSDANWQVALTHEGLFAFTYDQPTRLWKLSPGSAAESIVFQIDSSAKRDADADRLRPEFVVGGLFPGIAGVPFAVVAAWITVNGQMEPTIFEQIAQYPVQASTLVVSFIAVCLVAVVLTVQVARRRGLSGRQARLWCWSVPLLGIAAPLSMIAIYRQVHREPCPKCDRPRRVDMPMCEHCGGAWEPPANQGIEILDRPREHRLPVDAVP